MMKQSVLCLNVIDQHYLYFHLPAEGNTFTFTFDILFFYLYLTGTTSTNKFYLIFKYY